mgnify:CR=1 FL=1
MPIETIALPVGGLDDRDPYTLAPDRSPNLRNVRSHRQRMVKGPGSTLWAAAPASPGTPRSFAQVHFVSPTERLLMLTHTKAFRWDTATSAWVDLSEAYTGAASQRFSVANTQDRAVWSQGTNNIRNYNGSTVSQLVNHAARTLLAFNDRVISVYTNEGDGEHPARIRWSVNAVITDWTGLGSGSLEVIETSNAPLTGGFVLGERAYLTKAREIIELIATGSLSPVFRQETRISGTGMIARHSFGAAEYFGFFLGPDDVYLWDGASLRPVGAAVYKTITALLDYATLDTVQGVVHTTDSEYWLIVSETAEGGVFIYDYRADRWYRDHWPNVRALGIFRTGDTLTADIDQSEFVILGDSNAKTVRINPAAAAYDGVAIDSYFETRDMPARSFAGRETRVALDRLNTCYRVSGVATAQTEIGLSNDQGATYTTQTVDQTADHEQVKGFFVQPYQRLRIRMRNNSVNAWAVKGALEYEWVMSGVA